MSKRNLRHKPRISYYEPEEPDLDEYVFCEKCGDYVYEYCSIHGALLVIPDDKIATKPNVPPYVPRAALTIPHVFLHITYSIIPDAGLGVFTSMALPSGVRFGPYLGQRTDVVNSSYCWQIYDKNRKPLHCIDAADANKSNWMRYVNCARHWGEQNLVAYQYQGELYYRTIKIIPRFTELMVFYGSEFACELDVDLGKYNSPAGYAQKFGAPVAKKRKPNDENIKMKTYEDEIKTANAGKTAASEPTSAQGVIKDITTETQIGQVILTTIGPDQDKVKNTLSKTTTKPNFNKVKPTKNNAATKNWASKNNKTTKNNEVIENNKALRTAAKQDTACVVKPKYLTMKQESNEIDQDKVAQSKSNLTRQNSFLDLYKYCDSCNKRFVSKPELQRHLRFHDPNRKYACEICKLRYTSLLVLKSHLNSNKICNARFCRNDDVEKHNKTYNREKPYTCKICNARFTVNGSLKSHMRTHTGEKPYSCEICNARFTQSAHLKSHKRTHTGEKPYTCEICNARFTHSGNLKKHMRTHTGEKPYTCEICNTRLNQSGNLKKHMRTHTGEKPYTCEICNARFTQSGSLRIHMRTHNGEKPTCEICNAKFTSSKLLRNHLVNTHLIDK